MTLSNEVCQQCSSSSMATFIYGWTGKRKHNTTSLYRYSFTFNARTPYYSIDLFMERFKNGSACISSTYL